MYTYQKGMGGSPSAPEKLDLKDISLRAHNKFRERHNVPPLTYSKSLSLFARNQALYLTTKSKIIQTARYCEGGFLGENIAVKHLPTGSTDIDGAAVTEHWYNEIQLYSFSDNDPPESVKARCKHFTQLVWKDSKEVGFGVARKGKRAIVVACYKPQGNQYGRYAANVLQMKPEIKSSCLNCLTLSIEDID